MFDFGENLKELRLSNHLKQKDIADKLEVSATTVLRWENNYKYPSVENLIELATFYNVSLNYLVGLEHKKTVVVDQLSQEQQNIINTLVLEFRDPGRGKGLTQRQLDVLNSLIIEFTS